MPYAKAPKWPLAVSLDEEHSNPQPQVAVGRKSSLEETISYRTGQGFSQFYGISLDQVGAPAFRLVLLLDRRQRELLAQVVSESLPPPKISVLVPGQKAHPRLHIVVQPQHDVILLGNLA